MGEEKFGISINRLTLAEQVYIDIVDRIAKRALISGEKIVIRQIQEEYKISSSVARDTLNLLHHFGFVESFGNAGNRIVTAAIDEMEHVIEVYMHTSTIAVVLAFKHGQEQLIEKLKDNYNEQLRCMKEDPAKCGRLHADFINLISDYCGNFIFPQIEDPLLGRMVVAFGYYENVYGTPETMADCENIIKAFEEGDEDGAIKLIQKQAEYLQKYLHVAEMMV